MASPASVICVVAAAFVAVYLAAPAAAITCSDVVKDLKPCISYLKSGSGKPPSSCCTGASNLASTAKNKADKQTACNCLKNTAKNINPKPALAKSLPGNCGISLPFEVSPSVDCSKIS